MRSKDRKGPKSTYELDGADQGDWTRLEDNGSDKKSMVPIRGIKQDMTFDVEMSSLSGKDSSR